jgi:hypothetical protein
MVANHRRGIERRHGMTPPIPVLTVRMDREHKLRGA